MELYIVRHGQTEWNKAGKLQGHTDIDLNEEGRRLAIEYGQRLDQEGIKFDKIYSSPLIRAYETACLIRGRQNVPIIRDKRLEEISFGVEEGASYDDWLKDENPYRNFFMEPKSYNPPAEGDSLPEIMARTKEFIQEVIEPQANDTDRIMIVAHGALNKGLMCYLENNDLEHFWGKGLQRNCEADVFYFDGVKWK